MDKRTKIVTAVAMLTIGITFIVVLYIKSAVMHKIPAYIAFVLGAGVLVGESIAAYVVLTKPDKQ
ncbi:MAG: hypothetical protein WC496_08990 [Phycisphaerae bacterium]|jgi:formylmethanofuran dehydrogenase subunit A